MSLNTPTTTDSVGVTTTIVSDDTTLTNSLSTHHLKTDIVSTSESIKDFLAKPYLVYQNVWSSSDVLGKLLFGGFGLATDNFIKTIPAFYEKVKGFSMMRSTIVMRLQLNATPFHQGKLLLHFLPMSTMHSLTKNDTWNSMHNYNLTTRTMQPSIEIDCRETAVELRIPYISYTDYYAIDDGLIERADRGQVFLSVLSTLKGVGASPTVDYSFYISFEDVELVAPMVPQSKGGRLGRITAVKEKEAKAMATTPVANALSVAGKVASTLGSIPMLSSIATPASWVLQAASGLASAFGWSKPSNQDVVGAASRQYNRFAATSDGTDYCYPLALKVSNHITTSTAKSITDQDEMSFAFLKSVEAYIKTVPWAVSAAQGTTLYSQAIGPSQIYDRSVKSKGTGSVFLDTMPPAFYIANNFRQYRGAIKLRIRIAKTDFHSGRLQITYTPRPYPNTLPSVTSAFYSLREIIDIRAGNEIEITMPYMLSTPYQDIEQPMGHLTIMVLNELRAPENVAQSVDLLMYYSAGEDFELAVPGYSRVAANYVPVSPQSGADLATDNTLLAEGIGGTPVFRADVGFAEHCVGEIFTSIRQQLARYNQIWTSTLPPAGGPRVAVWPFFASCQTLSANAVPVLPKYGGDLFSFYAPMYTFYRGGMRLQVDTAAAVGSISATLTPGQVLAGRETFNTSTSLNGSASVVSYSLSQGTSPSGTATIDSGIGVYAVELPYYSRTAVSLVIPASNDLIPQRTNDLLDYSVPFSAVSLETQSTPVYYRAIAEDFQFTYFVGCPPLLRSATALAATPTVFPEELLVPDGASEEKSV